MTRADLRAEIALLAGVRTNPQTPLEKDTLNSVYAFLTGEFHTEPRAIYNPQHPEWSPRAHILYDIVVECEIGEPEDRWSAASPADQPRELRRAELERLLAEMSDRGDQREWAGRGRAIEL